MPQPRSFGWGSRSPRPRLRVAAAVMVLVPLAKGFTLDNGRVVHRARRAMIAGCDGGRALTCSTERAA